MRALRVALTADPYIPVPPRLYGGIERVVDLLARGLAARGHRITLIAHPESRVPGRLIPYGCPPHFGLVPRAVELWQVGSAVWRSRADVDIVHSFGRLAALLPILPLRRLPKVQSYHRPTVPWKGVRRAVRLAGDSICFTSCSASVQRGHGGTLGIEGRWHVVFNAVSLDGYSAAASVAPDAPLVFLGKLEPMKGAHSAIAIAQAARRRLVIAGNRAEEGLDAEYFEREIAPHIDGHAVQYVGPVDDEQKNALLGSALALLFPTSWEEAFGLVMTEAMACGTPVIAFARGAVPEVIHDGVTGFVCRDVSEAVRAVSRLHLIDRKAVRAECEARFGEAAMVDAYERLYLDMVAR
jgi:glycosyltransferase involved in cell wall biosynthesis